MSTHFVPNDILRYYRIEERHHAISILSSDFPNEFWDIIACLRNFKLKQSDILTPGGQRSPISKTLDGYLQNTCGGWKEKQFDVQVQIDGYTRQMPTHKIDNFRNSIGVEVEWNNKTEFYDRDLNNFRILWEYGVISVGVIITRVTELQDIFKALGKGSSYGASTTHWDRLMPKVNGGGAGGCPLLLIGVTPECYDPHL